MGEMIWVKCVGVDERTGKVRLSRKAAMKEMEAKKAAGVRAAHPPPPTEPGTGAPAPRRGARIFRHASLGHQRRRHRKRVPPRTRRGPARRRGREISVAAPRHEQSWVGAAKSRNRPVHSAAADRGFGCPTWIVDGTPSDCVNIAIDHLLPGPARRRRQRDQRRPQRLARASSSRAARSPAPGRGPCTACRQSPSRRTSPTRSTST